jgi:hypothetical protein
MTSKMPRDARFVNPKVKLTYVRSVIIKHAMFWFFCIIELPFFDRPDKDEPAACAQTERQNYQQYETFIHYA